MVGKLIRSHIAERIRARGEPVPIKSLDESDFRLALFSKMFEEADEIASSDGEDVNEFADLLQVLMTLASVSKIEWADVEKARARKLMESGGFNAQCYADFPDGSQTPVIRMLISRGDYSKAFPLVYANISVSDGRRLSEALNQIWNATSGREPYIAIVDAIIGAAWSRILKAYQKRDNDIHTRWLLNNVTYRSLEQFREVPGQIRIALDAGAKGATIKGVDAACRGIVPLSIILYGDLEKDKS